MVVFDNMDYSTFVGLVGERNRPSGGIKSVHSVVKNSGLNEGNSALEIGCNTGFTSLNLAELSGCSVVGLDINHQSIMKARDYVSSRGKEASVSFVEGSAANLPFGNSTFDLVWASNVASFVSDKSAFFSEASRVLKVGGTLSVIPIYYNSTPPISLVDRVSSAIGCSLKVFEKDDWKRMINDCANDSGVVLEQYFESDHVYLDASGRIPGFVDKLFSKPHLANMNLGVRSDLIREAFRFYNLFNENLKYCGFSVLLYQKRLQYDDDELFLSR